MTRLRDPLTGQLYPKDYFGVETVDSLLLLVDTVVPFKCIAFWSDEERQEAGDWALRTHLGASDGRYRVPLMPECVNRDRVKLDPVKVSDSLIGGAL